MAVPDEKEIYGTGEKNTLTKQLTKKERVVRRKLYERYEDMRDDPLRKEAEEEWDLADKAYRLWVPTKDSDDPRADIHLPDAFASIQTQAQETIDRKSRPVLERVEDSDKAIEAFGNGLMNYNMDRTGFDYEYYIAKLAASARGTAFLRDYWRYEERVVQDIESVDKETGEIKYKERTIIDYDDDYTGFIENEFVYIDPTARDDDDMTDAIIREILPIEEFQRIYGSRQDFINVKYVHPGGETTTRSFFQMPKDMREMDVEVLHYYNRAVDEYNVVANNMPIRIGPIPNKHKEIPLASVHQYRVAGRFWSLGIPKVVSQLTEERRSVRNMNIDRQKMQLNKMFIVNTAFDLDEEDLIMRPHGLIGVDTNGQPLNQVIQPLEYGDVSPSYFRTEEILLDDIRRATGIDDRQQGVNQGGTATEAAILKESTLKRINMIAQLSEMKTLVRIGRLKWSNIQFFYPLPRIERITLENGERKEKKKYRNINVEGREFKIEDGEGGPELVMDEIEGKSTIKLDKSMARFMEGDWDVRMDANAFSQLSKPIQQSKITEMFNLLSANPALLGVIDPRKAVNRYLEVNDERPKDWLKGDYDPIKMQELAESENLVMGSGQPLAPTEGATEEHTLVHINYAKSAEFQQLPEAVQAIITDHILGEHDANPSTGSAMEAMKQAAPAPGALPPGGPVEQATEPSLQTAEGPGNQLQSADIQPTNMGPQE